MLNPAYLGRGGSGLQVSPIMTSNVLPSPYVASASTELNASFAAWKAFSNLSNDRWIAQEPPVSPEWVQLQFVTPLWVNKYSVQALTGGGTNEPNAWTLQKSNNGVVFEIVDSQAGITWTSGQVRTFTLRSPAFALYFRLNVTAFNNAAELDIGEIRLYG